MSLLPPLPRPRQSVGPIVLLLVAFGGCAQPSPFAQRNAMIGSLRESVSNLESKNQMLERKVATLSSENRSLENRLVEEEAHSRALAQRLNDARVARGPLDDQSSDAFRTGATSPRRTQPASSPSPRRAPFAQIQSEIEPMGEPRPRDPLDLPSSPRSRGSASEDLFPSADDDDSGLQSRADERNTRWIVARDLDDARRTR